MQTGFRLAVCQSLVTETKSINLKRAEEMITEAANAGAEIIALPEMFNTPYDNSYFPKFAESYPGGETMEILRVIAAKHQIYLVGGSIPEKADGQIYNSSFIFGPDGKLIARHRKIHLFDVDLDSGLSFHESAALGQGDRITVFNTRLGKIGVAICYDLRFPELIRLMALKGAQVVVIPAAFNMTTGPAHWEITLRMRAVDNQVFMVGAAPARNPGAGYVAYGHSMVVEPWGQVIARAEAGEKIIYADIDLTRITKIRQELPLLQHRRTDLYELREAVGSDQ